MFGCHRHKKIPTEYTGSFLVFWGGFLAWTLIDGGMLTLAFALTAMMMVLSHEHAHAQKCLDLGVGVDKIVFNWLGGAVIISDCRYPADAVEILMAGVKDTAMYAFSFSGVFLSMLVFGKNIVGGLMFILYPFRDLAMVIAFAALVLTAVNCVPGTIYHEKYGPIRTDGWAACCFHETSTELFNDGRYLAISQF